MGKKTRNLTIREQLLDVVIEYAGDELETVSDAIELARNSEDELIERIVNLIEYYKQQAESYD